MIEILEYILAPIGGLIVLVVIAISIFRFTRATNGHFWHWLRAMLGWGKDIREVAARLGMTEQELRNVSPSFREVFVPKKRGGQRRLLVPDADLKSLQRRILHRLLKKLRAHPAAHGFERGRSIVTNALPHKGQRVVIKIDLVDFFTGTKANRIEQYFRRIGWNADVAALLTRLCTAEGSLPQGAPTSPRLSNLVNFNMDSRIARVVQQRNGQYTRYADDITISFPEDYPSRIRGVIQRVKRIVKQFGYRIHVRKKLQILRSHQQQRVTGLVVNRKVQLPRKVRRWLRAVQHRLKTRGSSTLTAKQLAGWRGMQIMIEQQRQRTG
ncbi:MAG: RNA-directed DNA polymerase [Planctomycetes bacterium]|nr:RNA-directed DNA polymerase [Planctomycetota bacterium]